MLIEKPGRMPGQMTGRSPYLTAVHLEAPVEAVGTIVPARIVASMTNSVAGELA